MSKVADPIHRVVLTSDQHGEDAHQPDTLEGSRCLPSAYLLIRRATDALVPDQKILDEFRTLPDDAAEGVLWGLQLLVDQLETSLDDLQAAVVDGSMTPAQALPLAQEKVLAAVKELRFGARLRPRRFYTRRTLPAVAELGRICAIVRHLAEDLVELSESSDGLHSTRHPAVHLRVRTSQ